MLPMVKLLWHKRSEQQQRSMRQQLIQTHMLLTRDLDHEPLQLHSQALPSQIEFRLNFLPSGECIDSAILQLKCTEILAAQQAPSTLDLALVVISNCMLPEHVHPTTFQFNFWTSNKYHNHAPTQALSISTDEPLLLVAVPAIEQSVLLICLGTQIPRLKPIDRVMEEVYLVENDDSLPAGHVALHAQYDRLSLFTTFRNIQDYLQFVKHV
ncbi:hypothetical protein B0H34DRAFT_678457 [Crassisporium funariophilum]|nr:hypothetical protein B0H34DRAFT_678457 [Crassisporium funariophilum]